MKRVKLADIAKAGNTSVAAVSAVLNNKVGQSIFVGKDTQTRVLQIAQDLGYVPNHASSRFFGRKSTLAGAILPTIESQYFAAFFEAFQRNLCKHDVSVILTTLEEATEEAENKAIYQLLSQNAYPLVISPHLGRTQSGNIDLIAKNHVPIISLDKRIDGIDRQFHVHADYEDAAYNLLQRFAAKKRARIVYVTKKKDSGPSLYACNAIEKAFKKLDLPFDPEFNIFAYDRRTPERILDIILEHCQGVMPDGIVFFKSGLVQNTPLLLREKSIVPGQGMSLAALEEDGLRRPANCDPVSAYAVDLQELGRVVADAAWDIINGKTPSFGQQFSHKMNFDDQGTI